MLVRFFRKTAWYSPILFVLIGVVLWSDVLLTPVKAINTITDPAGPLFELLRPLFEQYQMLTVLASMILLMIQSNVVNNVAVSKGFTERYSLLPGLMYMLLMCSTTVMVAPHPVLFANTFLIPAMGKLFDVYDEQHYIKEIFNIGFLISVAGLFYYPALTFILALIISIFMYYIVNLRTLIAAFVGLLTPFVFISAYFYLRDVFNLWIENVRIVIQPFLIFEIETDIYQKAFIALLALLSFFAFFRLQVIYKTSKPIRMRKRITILLLFFLISVVSFLLAVDYITVHYGMLAIPLRDRKSVV